MAKKLSTAKVLVCCVCDGKFSEVDVAALLYFRSTKTCAKCYEDMKKSPFSQWCFGKRTEKDSKGKPVHYGYNPKTKHCSPEDGLCKDRELCPLFVSGEIERRQQKAQSKLKKVGYFQKD